MWMVVLLACAERVALSPEAERGRVVYRANCTACHGVEPSLPGSVGPEVARASRALLEARLLRAAYPDGYTPKRTSQAMPPMPALEAEIDALVAYLASP
jgi:mono/diheme cytochrome c family protein